MYQDYMKLLFETLQNIKIYKKHDSILATSEAMEQIVAYFRQAKRAERKVYFIGNGGSAGIASHMTADFMKNGGMKTYNFYDSSLFTCMGNDLGYENIFSYPIESLAEKEDILVAISSSGNSKNIVNAIKSAEKKEMKVITFSGFEENNKIKAMGFYNIYVPKSHYGIVESIHNMLLQYIVDELHQKNN